MQALLTAVGVGLIAASIVIFTSGEVDGGPRGAVGFIFGLISLLLGRMLPRRHRHRHRKY
ncbi:MAG TPA: hypothetical protein VK422_07300 [Pyrinomonadaceae bacterium]|nr:hypothetical protein [Pyrinomonadaceae bacterium]